MEEYAVKLNSFHNRLKKIGVEITMIGNYPWIYLDTVNGKRVKEKFQADHGFTVAFLPARTDRNFHFTDLREIFKIIRKYA